MLKSQTLALDLHEKRAKLNELNMVDDPSTEQRAERDTLATRLIEIDKEARAVLAVENVTETRTLDNTENRELRGWLARPVWVGYIRRPLNTGLLTGLKRSCKTTTSWTATRYP